MWFQGINNCPSKYTEGINSWKEQNKSYAYIFWDEQNILELLLKYYPCYIQEWKNIDSVIKKCDSARYFILHHHGGIYADLDTYAYRPINDLSRFCDISNVDLVLNEENNSPQVWKSKISLRMAKDRDIKSVIGNAVLISKKGQKFWIDFLNEAFKVKEKPVLKSFSTWHLTKFYNDSKNTYNIKVLPANYFMLTNYRDEKTIATHKYDASWFDYSKDKPWDI